jgi:superoxide dismutase, Cu-Zn family
MKSLKIFLATLAVVFSFVTTVFSQVGHEGHMASEAKINKAICVLYPTTGNSVSGVVTFEKVSEGVKVNVDIHGLTPGKHGFHIHEFGDCSAQDATSAGGHFNPAMVNHGGPMDTMRHSGDMGNVIADASGNARMEYVDPSMKFEGSESIIGRSVIVHQNEDDLKTQPTGNAGPRVACGVIGVAK